MRSVFISYAANDPDWPADQVRDLAMALQQRGAAVLLDQFHQDQVPEQSINEWRDWMRDGVHKADHILCLASPRYLKAADRDVDDPSGYGVAFESQRLIHLLYGSKGHNKGRIVVALRDGMSIEQVVPEDFRMDCPLYGYPKRGEKMLQDLTRPLGGSIADAADEASSDAGRSGEDEPGLDDLIHRQESFATKRLEAAPAFFKALRVDVIEDDRDLRSWFDQGPAGFVQRMCHAGPAMVRKIMFAVRRVLKQSPQSHADEKIRKAAVAVYMLCACRLTKAADLLTESGRIVRVPPMLLNPIAVLSATLFGGEIVLRTGAGNEPVVDNAHEVRPVAGENSPDLLLREIYATLCPDDAGALALSRRDTGSVEDQQRMLSAIQSRIDDIRYVDRSSLTLIVECPAVFEQALWAAELQCKVFARDRELAKAFFEIPPDRLNSEIMELWRAITKIEKSPIPPAHHTKDSPMSSAAPSFHINATTVTLTTGDHSPATTTVTQVSNGPSLTDLLPLLADLRNEIDKVSANKLRDTLSAQVVDIEQVVKTRPADAKSRLQRGLEKIKVLSEAADGAEKLVDMAGKVAAAAAPVLALLS